MFHMFYHFFPIPEFIDMVTFIFFENSYLIMELIYDDHRCTYHFLRE